MMKYTDIVIGDSYVNIKHGTTYTITSVGLHSENYDMQVGYEDEHGDTWYRPIGLFCMKFEKGESK